MTWVGHVARMGQRRYAEFWWGNQIETDHLKDPGVDWTIIWRRTFRKWDGGHRLDWSGL